MELCLNFAYPVECYDNFFNKCAGIFCHVEYSLKIDTALFRLIIDQSMGEVYDPEACQLILNKTKNHTGDLNVSFYILFGGVVSVRFLSDLHDDAFFRPPCRPVYEVVRIPLNDVEKVQTLVRWSVCQIGKSYDVPRALLSMTPVTLRLEDENPDKFFCSQMMMYLIKTQKLFDVCKVNINHMNPDDVWVWLQNELKGDDKEDENAIKETVNITNEQQQSSTDDSDD